VIRSAAPKVAFPFKDEKSSLKLAQVAIRLMNGADPSPAAFDPTLGKNQVLKAVKPFIQ
jgi:hypothetical protein